MAVQPVESVTSILSAMPNRRHEFQIINRPEDFTVPRDPELFFTLNAKSTTQLGRTDSAWTYQNEFTAPILCKPVRHRFVLGEVTVKARFELPGDQAGIAVFLEPISRQNEVCRTSRRPLRFLSPGLKWARVALERLHNDLAITTLIGRPQNPLDWRFSTPFSPCGQVTDGHDHDVQVRLKLERVDNALWVWCKNSLEDEDSEYNPTPAVISQQWKRCDELVDFFASSREKVNVFVGCYASRPSTIAASGIDSGLTLTVEFHELDIL